jgi:hypothetical protein
MHKKNPAVPSLSSPPESDRLDLEDAFALKELKDMEMFSQVAISQYSKDSR